MPRFKPVIVVVAYNRPKSLERILHSLKRIRNATDVKLVISIDNQAPDNYPVRDMAMEFNWTAGEKEVIYQEARLGLRNHILQCASLSQQYGSVIILEDDLYVSPYFYDYAGSALDYYADDQEVAGISLYNQPFQEITELPFTPIEDDSDVYFLQHPSSWGQAWTADQWSAFMEWYDAKPDLQQIRMPDYIRSGWPVTSWKKYFCAYLAEKQKYFVFPRQSLTTNFNDAGTNFKKSVNHEGQTPLLIDGSDYRLKKLSDSMARYDTYLELQPEVLKKFTDNFDPFDLELDLYGTKDLEEIQKPYVITSRISSNPVRSFKRALKPHEMNVLFELEGNDLHLTRREDIKPHRSKQERRVNDHKYYFTRNILGWKAQLYNYYLKFKERSR